MYIRIRDIEWNIYKRYSQFYQLHSNLRKKDPIVNSFDFPPKKSIGNKSQQFVEDRRKCLQAYLRCIVNYLVSTNFSVGGNLDKETLLTLMPFFDDSNTDSSSRPVTLAPGVSTVTRSTGSTGSSQSIFSRRRNRSDQQPSNMIL